MKYAKLPAENLNAFMENLKSHGKIYGPKETGGFYSFQEFEKPVEMDLVYTRTMIPPKKLFLRLKEKMFTFDEKSGSYGEAEDGEKIVVLGMHPCDIAALKLTDKIYMDTFPDKYYKTRRENAVIVGYGCHPDEYCFCHSMGASYATNGFDLFLHELRGRFFVRVATTKGDLIAEENSKLFKDVDSADIKEFRDSEEYREREFTRKLAIHGLADMLSLTYEGDMWKEYAEKCLGCGSCNLVCPTCRCYDVIDKVGIDLKSGERVRMLMSCMLRKHGLVYGGKNFRPTRAERLKNRFSCKGSFKEEMMNCVGCGRCTVFCPSKIDYVEVLKRVRGGP